MDTDARLLALERALQRTRVALALTATLSIASFGVSAYAKFAGTDTAEVSNLIVRDNATKQIVFEVGTRTNKDGSRTAHWSLRAPGAPFSTSITADDEGAGFNMEKDETVLFSIRTGGLGASISSDFGGKSFNLGTELGINIRDGEEYFSAAPGQLTLKTHRGATLMRDAILLSSDSSDASTMIIPGTIGVTKNNGDVDGL